MVGPGAAATGASGLVPPVESGLLRAGKVLALVGACLWAAMAVFFALFAILFGLLFGSLLAEAEQQSGEAPPPAFRWFFGVFYGGIAVVGAAGSICGFIGWNKARHGDLGRGFVLCLIGALLPPLNIVGLLGAIFLKVCPEAAEQERAAQAWGRPR